MQTAVHENIRIGRNILVGTLYEYITDVVQNILTYPWHYSKIPLS